MKSTSILLAACLSVSSALTLSGCAGNRTEQSLAFYKQGQAAYKQQNYQTAFEKLIKAAKNGNADAQYAVGYMRYNGIGTLRDQSNALMWLQKAAKQGQPRAIEALQNLDNEAQKQIFNN